ncbi:unnamed protein product [Meloidogyne enterolobii]|uniref:Uncharacterized protein n=2 Tax=Meloidogyne enterolobii TaxID=390850 RepID=A0ACB0XZ23_MELEN
MMQNHLSILKFEDMKKMTKKRSENGIEITIQKIKKRCVNTFEITTKNLKKK